MFVRNLVGPCRTRLAGAAVLGLVCLSGCSRGVAWLDKRDQELPLVQRAAARASEGDVEAAIRLYGKALEQDPDAARAHLDLAFLLHDHVRDYVGAIYHYRRYLELRPGAEKQNLVEERVRLAQQSFAADVLGPNRIADKVAVLERDNAALRAQISMLSERLQMRSQSQGASASASAPEPVTKPMHIAGRDAVSTYRVKSGDTLTSIASEVYGDGKRWKDIQLANSDILGNSSQVRVGQVLVIP
ncbi:MAG: LysM peptidoglycan-binding domain-containing protein [Lentisphaerae bacterium]|nr:LysM peptidoglycan-binding domain-containing protein [Lentisphaerota bacterium]